MRHKSAFLLSLIGLIAVSAALAGAQNKLLTNDDVFGLPGRRVDFNGTPPGNLIWLKSGDAYLQAKTDRQKQTSTLMKVNVMTGESTPFFDSAVMEKALAGVEGVTAENARRLANQSSYEMNPAQTGVMLNFNGNLVYYEFSSA